MQGKHSREGVVWRVVSVVVCCSLLAYSVLITSLLFRQSQTPTISRTRPSYLMNSIEDLFDFITITTANCTNPQVIPGASVLETEDRTISGHEGTYICLDNLPETPTQESCRIYSFAINRNDIKFEATMGKRGCRVHLLAANTEYSYTRIKPNVYLYPLELNVSPGLNKYSLDGFLDLLTHMWKPIHYVKTTTQGSEWTFLKTLYLSGYEAFTHIKQIRLLLHLPYATDDHFKDLEGMYHLLLGLEYYGYRLVHSRPIPGSTYSIHNLQIQVATKYETVWIRD
ncbi:methyltransferase-like protein 24 [Portunus trituberculatus]|nr:methyltransferase-like protein 24 [Portunus trituberculatus]